MERTINGIQQVGIGVADAQIAFDWYKKYLGFDTVLFEDVAEAALMCRYTGGQVQERYAVLAMNMQGGGGLEIWQFTNRTPVAPGASVRLGDLGIFAVKIKCRNADSLHLQYSGEPAVRVLTKVATDPLGKKHFFVADPFGNHFQLIEQDDWFQDTKKRTGGVCGAIIGVSHLQRAVEFYERALDHHAVCIKDILSTDDLQGLPGAACEGTRAILSSHAQRRGAFGRLLGTSTIELIEAGGANSKIFDGRFWGDLGFIHVCYDLSSMKDHDRMCAEQGYPLTVNSGNSFEMGEAAGQFAYNEDPDGTLIEYVETHKVPILKSLGLYLHLNKRKTTKPLPDWIVKCLGFSKKTLHLYPLKKEVPKATRGLDVALEAPSLGMGAK